MPQKMILLPTGVAVDTASNMAINVDPDKVSINKKLNVNGLLTCTDFYGNKSVSIGQSAECNVPVSINNSDLSVRNGNFRCLDEENVTIFAVGHDTVNVNAEMIVSDALICNDPETGDVVLAANSEGVLLNKKAILTDELDVAGAVKFNGGDFEYDPTTQTLTVLNLKVLGEFSNSNTTASSFTVVAQDATGGATIQAKQALDKSKLELAQKALNEANMHFEQVKLVDNIYERIKTASDNLMTANASGDKVAISNALQALEELKATQAYKNFVAAVEAIDQAQLAVDACYNELAQDEDVIDEQQPEAVVIDQTAIDNAVKAQEQEALDNAVKAEDKVVNDKLVAYQKAVADTMAKKQVLDATDSSVIDLYRSDPNAGNNPAVQAYMSALSNYNDAVAAQDTAQQEFLAALSVVLLAEQTKTNDLRQQLFTATSAYNAASQVNDIFNKLNEAGSTGDIALYESLLASPEGLEYTKAKTAVDAVYNKLAPAESKFNSYKQKVIDAFPDNYSTLLPTFFPQNVN